jgi:hypothetical protein
MPRLPAPLTKSTRHPLPEFGEGAAVNAQDVCRQPKAPLMDAA